MSRQCPFLVESSTPAVLIVPAAQSLPLVSFPSVNGVNLGSAAHPLKHKDVIELAGVRMEFVNAPLQAAAA